MKRILILSLVVVFVIGICYFTGLFDMLLHAILEDVYDAQYERGLFAFENSGEISATEAIH